MDLARLFSDLGIYGCLFDADGTLFNTHIHFINAINEVEVYFMKKYDLPRAFVSEMYGFYRDEAHRRFCVDPEPTWRYSLTEFCRYLQFDPQDVEYCLEILMDIYNKPPQEIPGALETVAEIYRLGIPLGVVTHALPEWTEAKLRITGFAPYVQHVEIASVTAPKGPASWYNGLVALNLDPTHTLGVGDSITGDVTAAWTAGIRNLAWIDDPHGWQHFRTGDLPAGTITIPTLGHLFAGLQEAREHKLKLR